MLIIDINGAERACLSVRPDKDWPGYLKVQFKNKKRSYTQWYPVGDFKINNPQLAHLAKGATEPPPEVMGIVTKAAPRSVTDKMQKWETDLYIGIPVWISRGKGEGQVRTVIFNNNDTLTIDKEWEILPDETSQFIISYNVHNPQATGNTLAQSEIDSQVEKPKKKEGSKKKKI